MSSWEEQGGRGTSRGRAPSSSTNLRDRTTPQRCFFLSILCSEHSGTLLGPGRVLIQSSGLPSVNHVSWGPFRNPTPLPMTETRVPPVHPAPGGGWDTRRISHGEGRSRATAGRQAPIPVASGTGRPHAARPVSHPENKEAGPFCAAKIFSFPQGSLRGSPPPLAPPQRGWPGHTQRIWDWGQGGRQGRLWDRRPLPPPPLCRR